eukprot:CAMPEP_0194743262 /NCGR_PEP_ID=MMETSP0296-20130528/100215_1 /TAXON_ID=39354 /ORGANISM="Heterosigma akashiwo, Strain CCMP2393" /LENGTH=588 /DNA_ID=CAMNT_0039655271 /DNA_START=593 /DNA_END=2357 /DNA_ORIENTATION=+
MAFPLFPGKHGSKDGSIKGGEVSGSQTGSVRGRRSMSLREALEAARFSRAVVEDGRLSNSERGGAVEDGLFFSRAGDFAVEDGRGFPARIAVVEDEQCGAKGWGGVWVSDWFSWWSAVDVFREALEARGGAIEDGLFFSRAGDLAVEDGRGSPERSAVVTQVSVDQKLLSEIMSSGAVGLLSTEARKMVFEAVAASDRQQQEGGVFGECGGGGGGFGEQQSSLSPIMLQDRSGLEGRGLERSGLVGQRVESDVRGRHRELDVTRQTSSMVGGSSGGPDKFYKIVENADFGKLADSRHFIRFEKNLKMVAASAHCTHIFERSVQMEEGDATVNLFTLKLKQAIDIGLADVVEMSSVKDIMALLKEKHVEWQLAYRGVMRDDFKALEKMGGRNMVAWKRAAREVTEQLEAAGVVVHEVDLKDALLKAAEKVERYEKTISALEVGGPYGYEELCKKLEKADLLARRHDEEERRDKELRAAFATDARGGGAGARPHGSGHVGEPWPCRNCHQQGHHQMHCTEKCRYCQSPEHSGYYCPQRQACRLCGQQGHFQAACPQRGGGDGGGAGASGTGDRPTGGGGSGGGAAGDGAA